MKSDRRKPYGPVFLLLFTLFLALACSTPSWFPVKKGPPHKGKMKELVDKEVIIIDRQEYVKVLNPRVSEGGNQPKYLYLPVEEYLAKKEAFSAMSVQVEQKRKASSEMASLSSTPVRERESLPAHVLTAPVAQLKKKVLITYFVDRTTSAEESFGDWVAEKLVKEMSQRSFQILFSDYQMVKEFLEKKENPPFVLESPHISKMLNEVFGIHAIVTGELSGPYVFTTKGTRDQDGTSTAIIKIETKIVDTLTGKILKTLSTQNAIFPTKERGIFSDEKAKGKAFDLAISDLGRSLLRELDRLDWFCRVAKVDGEEVYINAGKLSGLKTGDMMEVYSPKHAGEKGEAKGRVQIVATFGMDASIGKLMQGNPPDAEDILKLAHRQGS